jgi:hypothetical protein
MDVLQRANELKPKGRKDVCAKSGSPLAAHTTSRSSIDATTVAGCTDTLAAEERLLDHYTKILPAGVLVLAIQDCRHDGIFSAFYWRYVLL